MCQAESSAGAKVWRGHRASSVAGGRKRGHRTRSWRRKEGPGQVQDSRALGFFLVSRIEAIESFKQVCSFKIPPAAGRRVACRVRQERGAAGLYRCEVMRS